MADEMPDGFRHRVDVAGRPGLGLRKHPPIGVEDAGGKVAAFPHDRAERCPDQGLRLFLDHGNESIPHDLHANCIEGATAHSCPAVLRSRTK